MRCDVEIYDPTPVVQQDDEPIQVAKPHCGDGEKVGGCDLTDMIAEKALPISVRFYAAAFR